MSKRKPPQESSLSESETAIADVGDDAAAELLSHLIPKLYKLDELVLDPTNANQHDERNLRTISQSLKRYGLRSPIVVHAESKRILKGNGTTIALRQLRDTLRATPAIATSDESLPDKQGHWHESLVRMLRADRVAALETSLAGIDAKAYAIIDNQAGKLATWNLEVLAVQFREISDAGFDPQITGFDQFEIEPLVQADAFKPTSLDGSDADGASGPQAGESTGDYNRHATAAAMKFDASQLATITRAAEHYKAEDDERAEMTIAAAIAAICAEYLDEDDEASNA